MTETTRTAPDPGPRVTREQMLDFSRLRRASDRRMLGGVAEGLGRHLDVDPLLIRVVFAILTVFGGAGLVLYVLAWISIPREGKYDSVLSRPLRLDPTRVMSAALLIAAVIASITMIGAITVSAPRPGPVLAVSLVAIVAFALISRRQEHSAQTSHTLQTSDVQAAVTTPTGTDAPLAAGSGDDGGALGYGSPTPGGIPPARPSRPPRSHLFGMTMAVIAIALGALWVVDETGTTVSPSVYPGTALGIIAVALIVGAWWGRSRLLILVGLFTTLLTAALTIVGPGPYGESIYAPASTAALRADYSYGAGRIVLHLDDLRDPEILDGRTISISSRVGQVELVVPSSLDVGVRAHVDHGNIRGLRSIQDFEQGEKLVSALPGSHDVNVDIQLRFGEVVVRQTVCPGPPLPNAENPITLQTQVGGTDVPAACN